MTASLYRVTINGSSASTVAPNDGFVDNVKVQDYVASGSTAPTTIDQTSAKQRANLRFKFLQQQIQLDANVYIGNTVSTGANATVQPTSFAFTAVVERGDDVLFTRDELNSGAPLIGTDALVRWVARGLIEGRTNNCDLWDPTKSSATGNSQQASRYGEKILPIVVGPVASNLTAATALVSVSKLN